MKTLTKLLTLLVAAVVSFAFVACSGDDDTTFAVGTYKFSAKMAIDLMSEENPFGFVYAGTFVFGEDDEATFTISLGMPEYDETTKEPTGNFDYQDLPYPGTFVKEGNVVTFSYEVEEYNFETSEFETVEKELVLTINGDVMTAKDTTEIPFVGVTMEINYEFTLDDEDDNETNYTMTGADIATTEIFGMSFTFKADKTGTAAISMFGMEEEPGNFTYKVNGNKITITITAPEAEEEEGELQTLSDEPETMEFVLTIKGNKLELDLNDLDEDNEMGEVAPFLEMVGITNGIMTFTKI